MTDDHDQRTDPRGAQRTDPSNDARSGDRPHAGGDNARADRSAPVAQDDVVGEAMRQPPPGDDGSAWRHAAGAETQQARPRGAGSEGGGFVGSGGSDDAGPAHDDEATPGRGENQAEFVRDKDED